MTRPTLVCSICNKKRASKGASLVQHMDACRQKALQERRERLRISKKGHKGRLSISDLSDSHHDAYSDQRSAVPPKPIYSTGANVDERHPNNYNKQDDFWVDSNSESTSRALATGDDGDVLVDALGVFDDIRDTVTISRETTGILGVAKPDPPNRCNSQSVEDAVEDGSPSITIKKGRLSTTSTAQSCTRTSFNDEHQTRAGVGIRKAEAGSAVATHDNSFNSGFDLFFARWLQDANISSNNIRKLMGNPAAGPLRKLVGWETPEELKAKMHNMYTTESEAIGKWYKRNVEIATDQTSTGQMTYSLRYQNVVDAIRFLMGHRGFKDQLIFEPYQLHCVDEPHQRLYTDMASGEWWWHAQADVGCSDATIVPLIVNSDKTQVTNHQGNLSAHPVYLSIGNIPAFVRNSNNRPGVILLALLPIVKDGSLTTRSGLYHECMRYLFDPVKDILQGGGVEIDCADGWTRWCFPLLAAMPLDYEGQVKVSGIRSDVQCTTCKVEPLQREDIQVWAP